MSQVGEERLAVIRNAHVEVEDHQNIVCVFFDAYVSECSVALQVVSPRDKRFLSLWEVMHGDVKTLNGKTCWVKQGDGLILFQRMANLGER